MTSQYQICTLQTSRSHFYNQTILKRKQLIRPLSLLGKSGLKVVAGESRAGRVDSGEALIRGQVSAPVLYTALSTSGSYNLTSVQYTGRAMGQSSLLTLPSCRAETHILSLYLKLKHITH